VIEWAPTLSVDVDTLAIPLLSDCGDPIAVVPSMKVTLPVGLPVPERGATIAANVTEVPGADGLELDVSEVVVARCVTVWVRAAEVDPAKLPSPL
jgi:hypothetical protein